jgi:hypothetical protein
MFGQSGAQVNVKGLPEVGLKLILATEGGLTPDSDPAVQLMLPYSVILSNNTQRAVVAYSLSRSRVNSDGSVSNQIARFVQPLDFMDGTTHRASRGRLAVMASKQRLISPTFNIRLPVSERSRSASIETSGR